VKHFSQLTGCGTHLREARGVRSFQTQESANPGLVPCLLEVTEDNDREWEIALHTDTQALGGSRLTQREWERGPFNKSI
jgi:hypothetical protein